MRKYYLYKLYRKASGVSEPVVPTSYSVDGDGEKVRWIVQENVEEIDCD